MKLKHILVVQGIFFIQIRIQMLYFTMRCLFGMILNNYADDISQEFFF